MKVFISILMLINGMVILAQATEQEPTTSTPSSLLGLSITGRSYPIFISGEEHSSFMVRYGFFKATQIELQGFYDTYLKSDRFRASLLGKVYLDDQLYLLSGFDMERETGKYGRTPVPHRLGVVAGIGYDIKDNFMFEVKSNVQLNNSNMGLFGESLIKMPAVYTIGSKIKF